MDNYIASYYSAGVQTFSRAFGGPLMVMAGIIILAVVRKPGMGVFLSAGAWAGGAALLAAGTLRTLRPWIDLGLVWLRREEFLGADEAISVELDTQAETLILQDTERVLTFPLSEIRSIQHRTNSAWILTQSDQLVYIPRHDLLDGDHDAFMGAIEAILDANEQKY